MSGSDSRPGSEKMKAVAACCGKLAATAMFRELARWIGEQLLR